ncbi:hypothetical protein LOK46_28055 [Methylobacterium sp. NMS14P]|uniref:hypothetical protein n=1 Tax=unclassified Methylobacterium TaxID=2615210 RepID=UPI002359CF4B|nr:hypothetical protein [Methylobacterium sp. NMS14P]WCS24933.1 hypothetical protein LOK46_28055 [Methylobacterium sp. NMS14P]
MEAISVEDRGGGRRAVNARLRRIAAATGVPIAAFFGAPAPRPLAELSELIGLWQSIADQEGRSEILAVARARAAGATDEAGGPA